MTTFYFISLSGYFAHSVQLICIMQMLTESWYSACMRGGATPPSASALCLGMDASCVLCFAGAMIPLFLSFTQMYYPQDLRHKLLGWVFL